MKILAVAAIGLTAILLAYMAGGLVDATEDFRTDEYTETFDGSTGVGESSTDIQLSSELWNSTLSNASATSNITADAINLSSYNSTSRQITVGGLSANTSRTITLVYATAGLSEYSGADDFALNLPTVIMAFIIVLSLSAIIFVIVSAIRR